MLQMYIFENGNFIPGDDNSIRIKKSDIFLLHQVTSSLFWYILIFITLIVITLTLFDQLLSIDSTTSENICYYKPVRIQIVQNLPSNERIWNFCSNNTLIKTLVRNKTKIQKKSLNFGHVCQNF